MEKVNKKRLSEKEIPDSFSESLNKKIKTVNNNEILEKFGCSNFYIDK